MRRVGRGLPGGRLPVEVEAPPNQVKTAMPLAAPTAPFGDQSAANAFTRRAGRGDGAE